MSSRDDEIEDAPRFPLKIRIKGPTKQRFESIFTLGKRVKGDVARIIALPGTGLVGIAVSKKIGSRPQRNKLKRRFREAILKLNDSFNREYDYVVVVHVEAVDKAFSQIESEVQSLFIRIGERWAAESESS